MDEAKEDWKEAKIESERMALAERQALLNTLTGIHGVNENIANKYKYTGSKLHLEMSTI